MNTTKVASVIINLVGKPGRRIVMFSEGGCHCEKHVPDIGWTLDNDAITDQQCAVVLDYVSRLTAFASKNA